MIPVRLKLSNFTSYGDNIPELDFAKFHLAAISGQNGAGKSSILDSITWVLWGWSRAGDNADQLVRLGATDMQVEFSFDLDGHEFTVKRRRTTKHGGNSALEFWSGTHNLTEGTIKATQQKIIDTLHLSFETFTNSSFLRQGHADEFTTKGPTDRKRILADILGLSHYDKLEEKAKEKARDAATKLQLIDYQFLEIEAELSQKEQRQKALTEAEEEAKKVQIQITEVDKLIRSINDEKEVVLASINSLKEKESQISEVKKELDDIKLQIAIKEKAKEEFQNILSKKQDIEENYLKLQKLSEEKQALETKRSELIKVKDQLVEVQKVLTQRENKRDQAISSLQIDVKKYQTENEQLQEQINHLTSHKDSCPTCGQNIGEDKNREIISKNKSQIEENNKLLEELNSKIKKYQEIVLPESVEVQKLEIAVTKLEQETKPWLEISQQILTLGKFQDLYVKLQQAETGVKTHLEAILDLQKIYHSKEEQISKSQKELEQLLEFQKVLSQVLEKLRAQEIIKQELSQKALELSGQVGQAKQLMERSEQLEKLFDQKKQEKENLTKEKESFETLAEAFGKKGIQAMIIETAIPEIEEEANSLLEKLTEGRMKVTLITQKETKTKVQTSEGKVHATVETLDIIISDEMGERPYELYSGGEAFRVNFAIRIALSKLLTRRAGAKLQFLIVDEGFGTQDAEGRSRIVEVMDAIKNDFEKILIITHLEELKEEFPTRIEVSKNSHGSTFEVIGD
jgi:DNA repair protein SbcC/Rad50